MSPALGWRHSKRMLLVSVHGLDVRRRLFWTLFFNVKLGLILNHVFVRRRHIVGSIHFVLIVADAVSMVVSSVSAQVSDVIDEDLTGKVLVTVCIGLL